MDRAGIFLLDKPAGISSARAIAIVRKRLNIKRIGHAGTLDPMATGLLIVLTGAATRLARFAESQTKKYSGTFLFGCESDTLDSTGVMMHTGCAVPGSDAVASVLPRFRGSIEQVPPAVSALKVDGERAYKIHRRGEAVVLPARKVHIEELACKKLTAEEYSFSVTCSKGTYIRSLARDIGQSLNCGAVLSSLRRDAIGRFTVDSAMGPEETEWSHLLHWSRVFDAGARMSVPPVVQARLYHGDVRPLAEVAPPPGIYFTEDDAGGTVLERKDEQWELLVNLGGQE